MLRKPLSGRTVVVTRPRAACAPLAAALRARGARVVFAPLTRPVAPRSSAALDAALKRLNRFDAIAFLSANAVAFFFARARRVLKARPASPKIIAAVGPATARAAAANGWRCTVVASDSRAAGLARVLRIGRGARVLIPRAERGLDVLPRALRAAGARVTVVSAYRTVRDAAGLVRLRRALRRGADAICLSSGSAVAALGARELRAAAAVAIGPTTAAALRGRGARPAAVAEHPDAAAFAQAVERALRERP